MAKFRLLHATDFHVATEPSRMNRYMLWSAADSKVNSATFKDHTIKLARLRTKSIDWENLPQNAAPLISQRVVEDFYFSTYKPEVAEQFARFIHNNPKDFDMLVLTGDLSNTGTAADIRSTSRYFAENPSWNLKTGSDSYGAPLQASVTKLIIPGNHDRYFDGSGIPNGRTFDLAFSQYWPSINSRTYASKSMRITYAATGIDEFLVVVGADFSLRSTNDVKGTQKVKLARVLGRGNCHSDVLKELVEVTQALQTNTPKAAIAWAVHFPVGTVEDDDLALQNWELIYDAAIANNISVILSGHVHKSFRIEHPRCCVFVAGSCAAVDMYRRHSFNVMTFETVGSQIDSVSTQTFEFLNDKDTFWPTDSNNFSLTHV